MPDGDKIKTRLPYWNLLFLALILSGGGFFWYTNYQQQLLARLDSQLVAIASSIDFFSDKITGDRLAQQLLCEDMSGFSAVSAELSSLAVYGSTGALLCFSDPDNSRNHIPIHHQIALPAAARISIETTRQGDFRTLIYPLSNKTRPLWISLSSRLHEMKSQLRLFASILFLAAISILTCFAILDRKMRGRSQTAMRSLSELMERTNADTRPPVFKVDDKAGLEAQTLARNYNALMARLADNLLRARQFAANVTHELRTPLTILRGETELALRNGRNPEQLRQVLESNLEEISRMSYLIEDLLLLSKTDLGEIPLKMEALDLTGLILELHHQAQLLAEAKHISVKCQVPEQQIVIHADSLRLRQVLLNLLTNAIKYTPAEGEVSISLEPDTEKIEIVINDTGIGIGGEHLEKIFERFYRVNKTHNRNDGGSGLGLAIVRWIVDAHGGTVKVSSIPGQGSKFTVSLPLTRRQMAQP